MNKKLKEIILYVSIFIFVLILPNLFHIYFSDRRENTSYIRIKKDHEICLQRAERDKVETRCVMKLNLLRCELSQKVEMRIKLIPVLY